MDANVAERYAESLYQLALEDHALEDYLADMKLVDTVLEVIQNLKNSSLMCL